MKPYLQILMRSLSYISIDDYLLNMKTIVLFFIFTFSFPCFSNAEVLGSLMDDKLREAEILARAGYYSKAIDLVERTLKSPENNDKKKQLQIASLHNFLGLLYKNTGNYMKAEPLLKEALKIRKQLLAEASPAIAVSMNNLATLYEKMGKNDKAERLLARALEITETAYGSDYPTTARALNNLAMIKLWKKPTGYIEAKSLFLRALTIAENLPKPDKTLVATILNNLAIVYIVSGDFAKTTELRLRSFNVIAGSD